ISTTVNNVPQIVIDSTYNARHKTIIDILPIVEYDATHYLILQHASVGPFFASPGLVLDFDSPAGPPTVVANCLTRPTTMTLDKKAGTLYVSEFGGRVVAIPFAP